MANKEILAENNRKYGIYDTLEKYHDEKDLLSLLKMELQSNSFSHVDDILRKLPETVKYDNLKYNILKKYNNKMHPYAVQQTIAGIINDKLKLRAIEKFSSRFDDDDLFAWSINSINSDRIRQEEFRKNINYYNSSSFSDYLRSIKDDELRLSEFLLYKEMFPDYILSWFAGAFETDEKRMEIFDTYYDDSRRKEISHFEGYLKDENNKIKLLDKYGDVLEKGDVDSFLTLMKNKEHILYVFNKYRNKISNYNLKKLIEGVKDDDLRIYMLDEVHTTLSPSSIIDIIIKINDIHKRIQVFDKYIEYFGYSELRTMLIFMDTDAAVEFLDSHIEYYSGEMLGDILKNHYFYRSITLENDDFISKYINYFDTYGLFLIIEPLVRNHNNIDGAVRYLLSKTNNKKIIRHIYNAVAFYDKDYFLNNLINTDVFTQEERDICEKLSGGNTNFYSYFLFDLFEIPTLKHNRYFLSKLAKYPKTSQKIVDLYRKKPNLIVLLLLLIKKVYGYDTYHDGITNSLIKLFSNPNNEFLNNITVASLDENRKIILIYKLLNGTYKENGLIDVDINNNDDIDTYEERRLKKIDECYLNSEDIDAKKNVLFNKIFGFNIEEANKLLDCYGFSLDKLDDSTHLKYIRMIKTIIDENNIETIDKYYNELPIMDLEERILLEQELKKIFCKGIKDGLYKVENNTPVKYMSYNGNNIPIYKPTGEFRLMVNSLLAYVRHDEITDYDAFINNNSKIQNHGICCSLISNQNICQTAPIDDIIVGYADFADTAIQLADSLDIYSANSGFELEASQCRFMTPQDYIDETTHSHNEFVIERTELRKNINSINLKPSYVIIYDYFDTNRVNKSLKAASELNIPIVYLDTKEIVARENKIITEYFNEAEKTLNIDLFKKMIVRYLNNFYGLINAQPDLLKIYFSNKRIESYVQIMLATISLSYNNGVIDKERAISLYNEIGKIVEKDTNTKPLVENVNRYLAKIQIIDTMNRKK